MDRLTASLIAGLGVALSGGVLWFVVTQTPWLLLLFIIGTIGGYVYDMISERMRAG